MNNQNSIEKHHDELESTHQSSHKLGIVTISLIFGLFGLWSIFAQIETTITANGKVITQTYNKIVMHPQGGIVKKIFVQEGDLVQENQSLLQIDNTEQSSQLASYIKKYDTNLFSICRYKAQADFKDRIDCSEYEKDVIDKNNLLQLRQNTQTLFDSDMKNIEAKIKFLERQNDVRKSENDGLKDQIESNKNLLSSLERELVKWEKLLKSNAIDELRIIETKRKIEQSRLHIGTLESSIKENIATIRAYEQQMVLEKETFKNIALTKLNEIELENRLTSDTIISLRNTIENTTIKAPSDGLVTDMKIHATGEVVSPQNQIMSIVPNDQKLIIEGYVLPTDIEKVYVGQEAEISFPAFVDPSAIPIEGKVTYISADAITIDSQQESYYVVLLELTPKGFSAMKQNDFKIIPGMPSTVFIKTGKKTFMEYLTQPLIQMFKGIYHAS